jgi:hypothetical protein
MDKPRRSRGIAGSALAALCAAPLAAALLAVAAPVAHASPGASAAALASASPRGLVAFVDGRHRARRVPDGFLGLSYELSALPRIASYHNTGDFVNLLRSLGHGVLRFGGVSADTRVAWADQLTPGPAWASVVITPDDLRRLAIVARLSGWRVLLTIGLVHFEPASAAREAAAAKAALGDRLAGIEVGNEPDSYMRHGQRTAPWTFSEYGLEAAAYQTAIAAAAPGVPLAGPDVSGSAAFMRWAPGEVTQLRPSLLTGHHYPMGCHDQPPPSIARLLSVKTRTAEAISTRRYMSIAKASGIRFRMDETNTVSCGGTPGISDTFASALWAVSYIVHTMQAGVAGINFHGEPANCHGYTPLCAPNGERLASGLLSARPEWYALLLTRELVGDSPLGTVVRRAPAPRRRGHAHHAALGSPPAGSGAASIPGSANGEQAPSDRGAGAGGSGRPDVSVSAMVARDGTLHVVLLDGEAPGAAPVPIRVRVGRGFGSARLLALTAPSPTVSDGETLGGATVWGDGSWHEPAHLPVLPNKRGAIALDMGPASAALLTLAPRRAQHR